MLHCMFSCDVCVCVDTALTVKVTLHNPRLLLLEDATDAHSHALVLQVTLTSIILSRC
jgi:hypothetical protein